MRFRLCLGFYFSALVLIATTMTAQVCNGVPYNPSFAICCGGVLSAPKGGDNACCGTKSYNTSLSICCGGVLTSPKGADNACCGTKSYWTNVTRCCPGNILRPSGWSC